VGLWLGVGESLEGELLVEDQIGSMDRGSLVDDRYESTGVGVKPTGSNFQRLRADSRKGCRDPERPGKGKDLVMVRIRDVALAVALATSGIGCVMFCDECDDFPFPGGPGGSPGYSMIPGSYTGPAIGAANHPRNPERPPTPESVPAEESVPTPPEANEAPSDSEIPAQPVDMDQ
jgi:hypothetical protein